LHRILRRISRNRHRGVTVRRTRGSKGGGAAVVKLGRDRSPAADGCCAAL